MSKEKTLSATVRLNSLSKSSGNLIVNNLLETTIIIDKNFDNAINRPQIRLFGKPYYHVRNVNVRDAYFKLKGKYPGNNEVINVIVKDDVLVLSDENWYNESKGTDGLRFEYNSWDVPNRYNGLSATDQFLQEQSIIKVPTYYKTNIAQIGYTGTDSYNVKTVSGKWTATFDEMANFSFLINNYTKPISGNSLTFSYSDEWYLGTYATLVHKRGGKLIKVYELGERALRIPTEQRGYNLIRAYTNHDGRLGGEKDEAVYSILIDVQKDDEIEYTLKVHELKRANFVFPETLENKPENFFTLRPVLAINRISPGFGSLNIVGLPVTTKVNLTIDGIVLGANLRRNKLPDSSNIREVKNNPALIEDKHAYEPYNFDMGFKGDAVTVQEMKGFTLNGSGMIAGTSSNFYLDVVPTSTNRYQSARKITVSGSSISSNTDRNNINFRWYDKPSMSNPWDAVRGNTLSYPMGSTGIRGLIRSNQNYLNYLIKKRLTSDDDYADAGGTNGSVLSTMALAGKLPDNVPDKLTVVGHSNLNKYPFGQNPFTRIIPFVSLQNSTTYTDIVQEDTYFFVLTSVNSSVGGFHMSDVNYKITSTLRADCWKDGVSIEIRDALSSEYILPSDIDTWGLNDRKVYKCKVKLNRDLVPGEDVIKFYLELTFNHQNSVYKNICYPLAVSVIPKQNQSNINWERYISDASFVMSLNRG